MVTVEHFPEKWCRLVAEQGECLNWLGCLTPDNYGRLGGKYAHRVVYERLVGPIPAGLELDHLCRNTRCVKPEHLEPVTRAENMRRRYAAYTHCKAGHEFTDSNTYVMPSGGRRCRACQSEACQKYRARRKERA